MIDLLHHPNLQLLDLVFIHLHLHLFIFNNPKSSGILRHPDRGRIHNPADLLGRCRPVSVSPVLRDDKDLVKVRTEVLHQAGRVSSAFHRPVSVRHLTSLRRPLLPTLQLHQRPTTNILRRTDPQVLLSPHLHLQRHHRLYINLHHYHSQLRPYVQPVLPLSGRYRSRPL